MPLLEGLRVVKSRIHGYGVIATRPFTEGDIIVHGDGVLYGPDDEFDDSYALILDREEDGCDNPLYWDLADQTRWINHSCDPNTEVMAKWDPVTETVAAWWVALRDLEIGEELTYDYAFTAEVAEPCACGAPTCRGVIVEDDPEVMEELPEHLRSLVRVPTRAAS